MNLHGKIMTLVASENLMREEYANTVVAYLNGHRDARHDAAELASKADALIAELVAALDNILIGMEASGGWAGDDGLFDAGTAAVKKAQQ